MCLLFVYTHLIKDKCEIWQKSIWLMASLAKLLRGLNISSARWAAPLKNRLCEYSCNVFPRSCHDCNLQHHVSLSFQYKFGLQRVGSHCQRPANACAMCVCSSVHTVWCVCVFCACNSSKIYATIIFTRHPSGRKKLLLLSRRRLLQDVVLTDVNIFHPLESADSFILSIVTCSCSKAMYSCKCCILIVCSLQVFYSIFRHCHGYNGHRQSQLWCCAACYYVAVCRTKIIK